MSTRMAAVDFVIHDVTVVFRVPPTHTSTRTSNPLGIVPQISRFSYGDLNNVCTCVRMCLGVYVLLVFYPRKFTKPPAPAAVKANCERVHACVYTCT